MIIKGKSRAGPSSLAAHLGNAEKNERVQLVETRFTVAQDLRGALIEMDAVAAGTRCEKPLYHAAISPEPPHRLTPEQRIEAVDELERKLGLEGHARAVVLHEKMGREHLHVVWSRIDLETMTAVHDGHNYRRHEEVARELERRFDQPRVQGAHAEREGPDGKVKRPDRTPSRAELRQEERTGIKGKAVKEQVSAIFRSSDGPQAFKAALEENGYQLAQGDRRDFVILDWAGGIHSLAKRIDGVRTAELREFMSPIDRASLPTTEEARAIAGDRGQRLAEARERLRIEKGFGRGEDYVSQSTAALKEHKRRLRQVSEVAGQDSAWERIEEGEARRARESEIGTGTDPAEVSRQNEESRKRLADEERPNSSPESGPSLDTVEMTDAMQDRLNRLHEAQGHDGTGPGSGRHGPAPGGGRPRGR